MVTLASTDLINVSDIDANGVGTNTGATLPQLATGLATHGTIDGTAVEQITSRTTGVTVNDVSGQITLVSAAGSTTAASFTVTNSKVSAGDVVVVCQKSGTDKYDLSVSAVAAGSFEITSRTYAGITTEQPVFNFVVIKANG